MFKKGDVVWSITDWNHKATVSVNKLTIKSWGKVQGTASLVENGKMINSQIYVKWADHLFLASDVENIEEFALEIAKQIKAKHIKHCLECVHWAYARNESSDGYYKAIKEKCQAIMDEEPKVILRHV